MHGERRGRRLATVLLGAAALTAATFGSAWADQAPVPTPAPGMAIPAPAPAAGPDLGAAMGGGVHPGVQTRTAGAQCTANFVFTGGGRTYLGQAAHCSGTGSADQTDGCTSASLPLGTPVAIGGASKPGKLAYNSWLAMQHSRREGPRRLRLQRPRARRDRPGRRREGQPRRAVLRRPVGVDTDGTAAGERVAATATPSCAAASPC